MIPLNTSPIVHSSVNQNQIEDNNHNLFVTDLFECVNDFPKHPIVMELKKLLDENQIHHTEQLEQLLNDDETFSDSLIDLISCPITGRVFDDPILVGGAVINRMGSDNLPTIQDPVTGPLTKFEHEDILTKKIVGIIYGLISKGFQGNGTEIENYVSELKQQPYFIEDCPRWCRLLSIVMSPRTYYIRKKGDNHFVIEARIPMQYERNSLHPYSVIRISYSIGERGWIQLTRNPNIKFHSIQELLNYYGCHDFEPLSQKERSFCENKMQKEVLLSQTSKLEGKLQKLFRDIVNILENHFDSEAITNILGYTTNKVLFRASVAPCSVPSFTMIFGNNKNKVCIIDGNFYIMNSIFFQMKGDTVFFKFFEEDKEVWKTLEELNNPPDLLKEQKYNRILDEWKSVSGYYDGIESGQLFIPSKIKLGVYLKRNKLVLSKVPRPNCYSNNFHHGIYG